jgi:uncharacterized protein YxjI
MPLLEMNRVFVKQRAKLIELTNEYALFDESGNQVGVVREEGQTVAKKLLRIVSSLDQFMTHAYSVYEADGTKALGLTRPRKLLKSKVEVVDGQGNALGTIAQQNVMGKKRFGLESAAGEPLGAINAENWRAWDFQILDGQGVEVGRITKKWAGIGKELFTTADNYLVELSESLSGPLRALALAAAVGIDTALKQDSN